MKIPRIAQCCCCGLKTGNIFWCWIEFFTTLSGLLISTYVFFMHGLYEMPVMLSIDNLFHPHKYCECLSFLLDYFMFLLDFHLHCLN